MLGRLSSCPRETAPSYQESLGGLPSGSSPPRASSFLSALGGGGQPASPFAFLLRLSSPSFGEAPRRSVFILIRGINCDKICEVI